LRTLLTIAIWESSFRKLTLFTSSPLARLDPPINHSSFHLSIASKSLQTCLPLFHASSIISAALGASCLHQAPSYNLHPFNLFYPLKIFFHISYNGCCLGFPKLQKYLPKSFKIIQKDSHLFKLLVQGGSKSGERIEPIDILSNLCNEN